MIVALLTDFGTRDHYVGTMKGVVLSVCPDATLVDISHDIAPQDVLAGALELAAAYRYFPPGTVFLAVIDPGVGSGRRAIAADAGGYRFVAPDNGLLTIALRESHPAHVVELREAKYARPHISRTFEGRDRFAPAAGWLARGIDLGSLGPDVTDPVLLDLPSPAIQDGEIRGEVLRIDRFGNLITNIDIAALDSLSTRDLMVLLDDRRIGPIVATYVDVERGNLCALVGSSGHLEIVVNGGSAADALHAHRGDIVRVQAPDVRPQ